VINASQAPSGRNFTSETVSPGKFYGVAAAHRMLAAPLADTNSQKNTSRQAADKCTDGDMVILMTTVQQIMTGLQTVDTEQDRFTVNMRAVWGLDMR